MGGFGKDIRILQICFGHHGWGEDTAYALAAHGRLRGSVVNQSKAQATDGRLTPQPSMFRGASAGPLGLSLQDHTMMSDMTDDARRLGGEGRKIGEAYVVRGHEAERRGK